MMDNPLILLVEDAPADVLLTQRALRKSSIKAELLVVTDGAQALQVIEGSRNCDISLVLLDLHLPKIDGFHILQKIRTHEHMRSMPVVVVTSSELVSDRSGASEFGADGYISKPIDPAKLRQIVEDLDIKALKPSEE